MMQVAVVGADGFVGKNLTLLLEKKYKIVVHPVSRKTTQRQLAAVMADSDVVINLAGVNRPSNGDFSDNYMVLDQLMKTASHCAVSPRFFHLSSTKAVEASEYGRSKALAEQKLQEAVCFKETMIYRAPNIYGKWCKPNYNSFISTCIHNVHNGLDIEFQDNPITLIYIDDLCAGIVAFISDGAAAAQDIFQQAEITTSVKSIVKKLQRFKQCSAIHLPDVRDVNDKKLYATYLSALPPTQFVQSYRALSDPRGSFAELFKGLSGGQISVNKTIGDGIKGNHWHNTKCEKFIPITGTVVLSFRHMITQNSFEITVSSAVQEMIDIPPGYAHSMRNANPDEETCVLMWANEEFDHDRPDTIAEVV